MYCLRRKVVVVLGGLCAFVALNLLSEVHAAEKTRAIIMVSDVITMPRKPVALQARLVEDGLISQTGLGGELLQFSVGGLDAGTAMTGGDGRAFCCGAKNEFSTPMRGNQIIRVTLVNSKRVEDAEGVGTLANWERRRPLLFVEVAAVIQKGKLPSGMLPELSMKLGLGSLLPPAKDAATNLDRLTKFYFNVVYVSRGGALEVKQLRRWLKEHEFPFGFPVAIKPEKKALEATLEDFKKKGWDNHKGGIGRTLEFAQTFAERRIKVVILSESGKDGAYPRKTKWGKDWLEVRRQIQG